VGRLALQLHLCSHLPAGSTGNSTGLAPLNTLGQEKAALSEMGGLLFAYKLGVFQFGTRNSGNEITIVLCMFCVSEMLLLSLPMGYLKKKKKKKKKKRSGLWMTYKTF
jgi:hypothetical protein